MQRLRRLIGRRSCRLSEGCFVAEGTKVVGEALAAGASIEAVYVDPVRAGDGERALLARCHDGGLAVHDLEGGVIERVSGTVHPQPVLAVVRTPGDTLDRLAALGPTLVVVAVDVRDPGNAGTLLRSAEASGADGVVFCEGSVDVYNPKTVRASAGALFHLPVVAAGPADDVLAVVGAWGLVRLGAAARRGPDHTEVDLTRPLALVLGNEAHGLTADVDEAIDEWVSIPMQGRAESLNVGIAAAVVCFETARQRRGATRGPEVASR